MTDRRISVHDRVLALQALERSAFELNRIASWLASCGIETESDMIEGAARDLLASCHLLERPIRARPTPDRWQQAR